MYQKRRQLQMRLRISMKVQFEVRFSWDGKEKAVAFISEPDSKEVVETLMKDVAVAVNKELFPNSELAD